MSAMRLKTVNLANGETLGYREREGGEKVLLLIHGNMTSSKHWDILIDKIDNDYKIIAVDMRGFGISTYHTPVHTIKDFSDDIKLFVDQLGIKDFVIAGWSTGGVVGMQFVADYPGYCNRLILVESVSTRGIALYEVNSEGKEDYSKRLKTYEDFLKDPLRIIPIQNAYDTRNKEVLKAIWNALIYTHNQPDEKHYDEYLDDMITQRNLAEVYYALNKYNISEYHNGLVDGNGLVKKIKIPVLILRGDRDLVITDKMTKEIVEDLGEVGTFIELPDCGHSPLIDNLELLLNHMHKFMKQKELAK